MAKRRPRPPTPEKRVRCAVYTRKSTEEGLEQEFNSFDAQRESGEAYIASQKAEGWECLPDRYDDGGYTGGNMERPALKRMMADIEAGKIDCVVVYKVDRLSRSLFDFGRIMESFDQQHVSFVSVTQHFNTTHSMGRLTLNILLSFAQFEREIISERTRDKIAAARRKGKWSGGHPVLGYDLLLSPAGSKLIVNNDEARRVRTIFDIYLRQEKLIPVVQELARRGWNTKTWATRKGQTRGGRPFDKNSLFKMLTNPVYLGKVKYRDELHAGEHAAIVDEQIWQRAQTVLHRNGRNGGAAVKNKYGALLRGLIRCVPCDASMGHCYSAKGPRRYRYYVCMHAQKRGWQACPSKSLPAGELERFVIDQIRGVARDPTVLEETVREVQRQSRRTVGELEAERDALERDVVRQTAALRKRVAANGTTGNGAETARLRDQVRTLEQRATEVRERIVALSREIVDQREVENALALFDPVWDTLTPREQARVIQLLVERVDYDGRRNTIAITFRPNGIKTLARQKEESAA
ncbi:MAG: recombinase family protein [Phycisphaerae bacterium]